MCNKNFTMSPLSLIMVTPVLPSLLLFFITLLFSLINGKSVNPPNSACPSFHCGDGFIIRYPFWRRYSQFQPDHCGYPSFGITCSDHSPTLRLSGHLYRLKNLDYSENTLTVAYGGVTDKTCPVAPHNVTLNSNPNSFFLNYTLDDKMIRFYYNCSLYPPSVRYIECLGYGGKRSYVFVEGAVPEFDWGGYCESTVEAVVGSGGVDGDALVSGFGGALREGFKLRWGAENGPCGSCEASGGFCGYNNYNINGSYPKFFCICSGGRRHSASCGGAGVVSIKFKPNFTAIGALIFGGLTIASTIFYFIRKKNIGKHKRGFSQIPSNGK